MSDEEQDPYALLDVKTEATEAEIRKAYRQRSLKVHPDRNPDNPDAARLFHELTQACELLLDPLRRLAVDAKQRLARARKERFASYDNKRKTMVDELEQRERAFKKARVDKDREERARWTENERIKDEGRRMREERAKVMTEAEAPRPEPAAPAEDDPPLVGSLDTTVRLKYQLSAHPTLTTAEALVALLASFGTVDASSVVLSMKAPKKAPHKPPKTATALVPFAQIGAAFAAVCASGRAQRGLDGVDIAWAEGKEPELIGWLKRHGQLGAPKSSLSPPARSVSPLPTTGHAGTSKTFLSFPSSFPDTFPAATTPKPAEVPGVLNFESLTLMRMRQAERERLEREIREQEAAEG